MNALIIAITLFVASSAWGVDVPCGTTISSSGTYTLEGNKSCDGTWVTIAANDVSINMAGYTVTYAGATESNGVVLGNPSQNFELYGGTITEGLDSHVRTNAIYTQTQNITGLHLHNLTINTVSGASNGMHFQDLSARTYTINIHDNTLNINPAAPTISSYYPNGIWFNGGSASTIGAGEGIYSNTVNMGANMPSGGRPTPIYGMHGTADYKFPIHHNTITMNGLQQQGIRAYNTSYQSIHGNTITASVTSDNVRGIVLDGGSSNSDVYDNVITFLSTNNTSNSYAIQSRYQASNNTIYNNTIDISGTTGNPSRGITIGGEQVPTPSGPVSAVNVYGNTITAGASSCFMLVGGLELSNIYCNSCNQTSGYAVSSTPGDDSSLVATVALSSNSFTIGGTGKRFYLYTGMTFSGVDYCSNTVNGSSVVEADFQGTFSGITITESGCNNTCSGTPPPATPTAAGRITAKGSFHAR